MTTSTFMCDDIIVFCPFSFHLEPFDPYARSISVISTPVVRG